MINVKTVEKMLVGMSIKDAEIIALSNEWCLRTMKEDGEDYAGTADFVVNRINISLISGRVDAILSIG